MKIRLILAVLTIVVAACSNGSPSPDETAFPTTDCSDGGVCDSDAAPEVDEPGPDDVDGKADSSGWVSVGPVNAGGLSRWVSAPRDGFSSVQVRSIATFDRWGNETNVARTEDINADCVHSGKTHANFRYTPCSFKIRNTSRGSRSGSGQDAVLHYRFRTDRAR